MPRSWATVLVVVALGCKSDATPDERDSATDPEHAEGAGPDAIATLPEPEPLPHREVGIGSCCRTDAKTGEPVDCESAVFEPAAWAQHTCKSDKLRTRYCSDACRWRADPDGGLPACDCPAGFVPPFGTDLDVAPKP